MAISTQRVVGRFEAGDGAVAPSRAVPLVGTKLRAPQRGPSYRDRARISAGLDATLDDSTRLTLLSAPPGYGKSMAVAGWAAARGVPTAWLSLDRADSDPVRFLRYLVAALAPLRPAADLLVAEPDALASADAGALVIDAMASADDPFALVLDDYHVIDSGAVHGLLRDLVEHGPPFAHIVILTREDPPLPLPRLRAHRRLVEMRADDLRYTTDEAATYLRETYGLELDDEHLARLVEATEGWIAGLQLAALSLRGGAPSAPFIDAFCGCQRYVLDYLATEVIEGLDPELRTFLVRSSVAERFTAGLCRELTGRADSVGLLDRAERMNLFLLPLDGDGRWYRFHHLFAEYLRSLLDPPEAVALRERAADWLEEAGLIDEAIDQAIAAGSTERGLRLLQREARRTYDAGEVTLLLQRLDALPRERVSADADLAWLRALACFMVGRVRDAAQACDEGERAVTGGGARAGLGLVRALIAAFGNRPDALELAHAAVAAAPDDDFIAPFARQALATSQLAAGQLEEAAESARQAMHATEGRGSSVVVPAMTALANALNFGGRRRDAEALCRETLTRYEREARHLGGGTPYAMFWLGAMRYEANDLAGALREMERAWAAMGTFGFGRALLTSMVEYLALARQAAGQPPGALDAVRIVERDARRAGLGGVEESLAAIEARLLLAQGEVAAAARWADAFVRNGRLDAGVERVPWADLGGTLTAARVRLVQGRLDEARRLLAISRATAEASRDVADLVSIGLLDAVAAVEARDPVAAEGALGGAIVLAADEGYARRIVDDGAVVAVMLPRVRRLAPDFVDAVTSSVAQGGGAGPSAGRASSALARDADGVLVEPLTDRELEVLRLIAAGRSDAAIADALVISLATAKWHAAHIRAKLGVTSRTQAVLRAQKLELV